MDEELEWWWSALLSGSGLLVSIGYLLRGRGSRQGSRPNHDAADWNPFLIQDRPWRRLGAAICGLVSVMFFVGVNFLDSKREPVTYLVFWGVVFLLIFWLCLLVGIDILRTQRLRTELTHQFESASLPTDNGDADPPPRDEEPQ